MAHVVGNKVRRAYNHAQHMEERRQLMQWWADFIDQQSGANVIPLDGAGEMGRKKTGGYGPNVVLA
jgi:hypothetical protein